MDNKEFIEDIKSRYKTKIAGHTEHNPLRISLQAEGDSLYDIAEYFLKELKFRFIIASALHTRNGFEILYHFSNDLGGQVINLHVILPHENPSVRSLTGLLSAVEWIEREMHELLGIDFEGHPNMVPLISEGNWDKGTYPYRKGFTP